jgi:hypothetical protein
MPDQMGNPCTEHGVLTCFCDEDRDRAAGVHRPSSEANAFGGYQCVCGGTWLTLMRKCAGSPVPEPQEER